MISRIVPLNVAGVPPSAFSPGEQERALRITFHSSSFADLPAVESEALEALLQLANLPEIEALETEPGAYPHLELTDPADDHGYVSVVVRKPEAAIRSAVLVPDYLLNIACELAGQRDPRSTEVRSVHADLVLALAHHSLRQDILVTLSPRLLKHRDAPFIHASNPRTPCEAARIAGLFLRSRGNYTYWASDRGTMSMDRGRFYWVLARHRLPSLWRYFSACVAAEEIRRDDILHLGNSILVRCTRALEARDAIGTQFYLPQDNNTRDAMMYHFEYLTLLLSGVFDAQARVAHRAYRIERPKERYASFRGKDFLREMQNRDDDLYRVVSKQHFCDTMKLLYELRNTIHGASMPTLGAFDGREETSFIQVLSPYDTDLWQAAERHSSPEYWGLQKSFTNEIWLEPYTYAVALTTECFGLVDAIASATNVTGLFPAEYPIPPLLNGPPEEGVFETKKRRRIDILG